MLRRTLAIARHELRVMKTDPGTPLFLVVMPLLMMAFLRPLYRLTVQNQGYQDANGAEQAVPGMAVMFLGFFVGFVGFSFLRDHGWGTWERLRASQASPAEIMAGKILPPFAVSLLQLGVLFAVGGVLFDLRVRGSLAGVVLVGAALAICLNAFGVAITALCRTSGQMNVVSSVGGMVFATFGGALVPTSVMPGWAEFVAPVTPTYWAMQGFEEVILKGAGVASAVAPSLVLLAFGAGFALVALWRFRFEETKIYWG